MSKFRSVFKIILVWLFFLLLFLGIHSLKNGFWSSDDPYYHAKHSYLIAQTGNLTLVEPWLEFHFFKTAPTDPWWGYHVLMAGLIHFFGIVWGAKVLTALLASLFFAVFYLLLLTFDIKKPLLWTLVFFSSSSFFEYRVFLERPFLVALVILPVAFWLIIKGKNIWLFFLAILFALLYNLAPLIVVISLLFLLVKFYTERKFDFKPLLFGTLGVIVGIILHPFSFNYLKVMYVHFFLVVFLKLFGIDLGIGNEVQVQSFQSFATSNFLLLAGYVVACSIFIAFKKYRKDLVLVYLFVLSTFWFLVTLLVPRGGDFWVPFAGLFIFYLFGIFSKSEEYNEIKIFIKARVNLKLLLPIIFTVFLVLMLNNFSQVANYVFETNKSSVKNLYYEQANNWLRQNTSKGEIVFYNDWSYWPLMFFYNDYNHYVLGMDPTFLYQYDKKLFWLWSNISRRGMFCENSDGCLLSNPRQKQSLIKAAIKDKFRASYVFVENNEEDSLLQVLTNRKQDFVKVYANQGVIIFRLK